MNSISPNFPSQGIILRSGQKGDLESETPISLGVRFELPIPSSETKCSILMLDSSKVKPRRSQFIQMVYFSPLTMLLDLPCHVLTNKICKMVCRKANLISSLMLNSSKSHFRSQFAYENPQVSKFMYFSRAYYKRISKDLSGNCLGKQSKNWHHITSLWQ